MSNRTMLRDLRAENPHHDIWVGDGAVYTASESTPSTDEAFGALMVVAYEHLAGHPILPSRVMADVEDDIGIYALARTLKDPEDAAEYILGRTHRPHINEFLGNLLHLVEDLHERGVKMRDIQTTIETKLPYLAATAVRVDSGLPATSRCGQLCTSVWQELLQRQADA